MTLPTIIRDRTNDGIDIVDFLVDRMDALVWAITHLVNRGRIKIWI